MLPWCDAVTEEIEVSDWRLRGAMPQWDAKLSLFGKPSISVESQAQIGFGTYPLHSQEASLGIVVLEGADNSALIASVLAHAAPRVSAAALRGPVPATDRVPPRDTMSFSQGPPDRLTSASKAGHDSNRMLRNWSMTVDVH